MKWFFRDRPFIKNMLVVALPVSVQFLISTSINMADTVMISSLGGASIAAVGLVNQFVFFFMIVCFGICSAGSVFFAQHFGNNDLPEVRRYLSISIQLTTLIGILFSLVSLLFPQAIMRMLIPDPEVIDIGSGYLRIIAPSFVITGISMSFNTVLRSVKRANEPLRVSILAFVTNVFFNYVFIFGHFGAPALGARGAAIGTLLARFLEVVLLSYLVLRKRPAGEVRPIGLFAFDGARLRRYFQIGVPIILAETLWSFGQLLFAVAYGRIGQDAAAAIQLTATIQNVFFILTNSLSTAATVLIGHSLGAGETQPAFTRATYFLQLTVILGLISVAILSLLPDVLLQIYTNLEPHLFQTARGLLIVRGLFIPFRYLNAMLFVGILRAGGDTRVPLMIEMVTMWMFAIPMTFIGVLWLHWPITWILVTVSMEELIKFIAVSVRFIKRSWVRNITQQGQPSSSAP